MNLQKQIKKLKVNAPAVNELTVEMIKKLCFVGPIGEQLRGLTSLRSEIEEETKSERSATTAATVNEPTEAELVGLTIMRLGFQNIGPTVSNLEMFT